MAQMYKFENRKIWDFDNMFQFQSREIEKFVFNKSEQVKPTSIMKTYCCSNASELMFQKGSVKQRLIFYTKQYEYGNFELQKISEFKIWCASTDKLIPD